MGDNPSIYRDEVELTIRLKLDVAAKLATYRREMHPGRTDEQVAAYLVRDALVSLGVLELPRANRAGRAGR